MKNNPTAGSRSPFDLTLPPTQVPRAVEGWKRLATGVRGARLYRVQLRAGAGVYWEAGVTLKGELVHRRFASELHARAWLSMASQPHRTLSAPDLEELNGPFRAASVAREG